MLRLRPFLPYFALSLLALIAAEPLARAALTCSDDGAFHLFRAVELGALIQAGHWFPRWSAHMAQGYGFPFYNFYAPLSSYFVVLWHTLGLTYLTALKVVFALSLWLTGVAAFLFVRETWGERAGLVSGAAYLFAPYLAYDVLYRGNLAESLAFIWPPLILWSLRRSAVSPRPSTAPRWLTSNFPLLTSVFYAALILTHNIFALIASPLLAGYVMLMAWRARSWKTLWRGALALALGIALTTYFWLPALTERGLVHSDRLLVPPIFTWHTNFITLPQLLAAPRPDDPLLLNPSPARAIGLLPALLCLPALLTVRRKHWAFEVWGLIFFTLALLGYGALTLEISAPVWRLLKPLELVQFPWRMLGPATLCAAVLIGASVHALEKQWPTLARFSASAFLFLSVAGNLPAWYPRYCAFTSPGTVADMVRFEQGSHTIGTTAKGEYLPRTSDGVPAGDDSLAQALINGEEPSRLQVVSGDADLTSPAPRDPLNATFTLTARAESTLVYRQFYYPGWQVRIDGQPALIRITATDGLISFRIPPGAHTVKIEFGLTPLRAIANAISLLALLGLAALFLLFRAPPLNLESWNLNLGIWDLGFVLLLIALKFLILDRVPNPLRHTAFNGESVATAQTSLRADFAGGVNLYGYDLSSRALPADGFVDAALYVAVREPTPNRYWPTFYVEDANGLRWNAADVLPPRWHREPPPTSEWPLGQYAQWARHITLLPGTPPGEYQLLAEIFDLDSLRIMSVLDEQGNARAPNLILGTITVMRPRAPAPLQPEHLAPHTFGPLDLLGYALPLAEANAGDVLPLTLYWRSASAPGRDYTARLTLRDALGRQAFVLDTAPVPNFPTAQWHAGDAWRGQHRLPLPATLADGVYTLSVSIEGENGTQDLATVRVHTPPHQFTPPTFASGQGAAFEGVGVLEGYTLERGDNQLSLTLIWRATVTPLTGYKVFVHLEEVNGRVWAQSDGVPAQWTRPTTGWVPGEYIADTHTFTLPPDAPAELTMWVGLYDPAMGARVPASGPGAQADGRVQLEGMGGP